jgi:hypothetical protein
LAVDILHHLECQGLRLAVITSDVVDRFDSLCVASLGEEIFGRLGDLEDEESNQGKEKSDATESNHDVPPGEVVLLVQ